MRTRRTAPASLLVTCILGVAGIVAAVPPSHAGFGDALKKLKDKTDKKAADAVDKAVHVVEQPGARKDSTETATGSQAATPAAAPTAAPAADGDAKVAAVSTKFD